MQYRVSVGQKTFDVTVDLIGGAPASAAPPAARPSVPILTPAASAGTEERILCPIPGNIWKILVSAGQQVAAGECVMILEAMKMEQEITAPRAGVVKQILVSQGAAVQTDDVLVVLN